MFVDKSYLMKQPEKILGKFINYQQGFEKGYIQIQESLQLQLGEYLELSSCCQVHP